MPIELAQTIPLIDHHCHGITGKDLDYVNFQKFLSESYRPPPEGTSDFQKPVGLAVRRFCAPLLDLEKGVSGEDYVRRRQELGPDEVNRRLMRACGLSHLLIDTGHRASVILDVPDMAKVANVPTFEVVRIEALAEEVMRGGVSADARLLAALDMALSDDGAPIEELRFDSHLVEIATALAALDPSSVAKSADAPCARAVSRAREFLDAEFASAVTSAAESTRE